MKGVWKVFLAFVSSTLLFGLPVLVSSADESHPYRQDANFMEGEWYEDELISSEYSTRRFLLDDSNATVDDSNNSTWNDPNSTWVDWNSTIDDTNSTIDDTNSTIDDTNSTDSNSTLGFESWSFVAMADTHNAEPFAVSVNAAEQYFQRTLNRLISIHDTYGGDLVLVSGDTNRGKWDDQEFRDLVNIKDPKRAILFGAQNCFSKFRRLFENSGYEKVLVALGDHELGDNPWEATKAEYRLWFRQGFQKAVNRDFATGDFMYGGKIGTVWARPFGTEFFETSYAYRHKNVLFVTMDLFQYHEGKKDYYDRTKSVGGNGFITSAVTGDYKQWLDDVLREARKDPEIHFIIVHGHVPVLQPVRRYRSSAMLFDGGHNSAFWRTLKRHKVDLYLAGDAHRVTASHGKTGPIQIVSDSKKFHYFQTINVWNSTTIEVTSYRKELINDEEDFSYVSDGSIVLEKETRNDQIKVAHSSGSLVPVKRFAHPLIKFTFEETVAAGYSKEIRGKDCSRQFENSGDLGKGYNAFTRGITLVKGKRGEHAAWFRGGKSRLGVFNRGPFGGGEIMSFGMYFKQFPKESSGRRILFHYGHSSKNRLQKDFLSLILRNGSPILLISDESRLKPQRKLSLGNGKWHHIAISMPFEGCKLSRVQLFVDGREITTSVEGPDLNIFQVSSGVMSLGGFGFSNDEFDKLFPYWEPFVGAIDHFVLWGKSITKNDLDLLQK